ncbi:MAG: insulinase family protein [Deltaproteobacteria bacterium]|nr:insulinase family protein [Deltaproteobacteria bacterium]
MSNTAKTCLILPGILLMSILLSGYAKAGEPELYRLPNGLGVLLQQDKRFPLVSMRLLVHAGSTYEKADEAGISHLLEHMVFKGSAKHPDLDLAADIEKNGGYTNAYTSFDYTGYVADLPAEHWRVGLEALESTAFHPRLDPADLEAEKKVVIAELKRGDDDPSGLIFDRLLASALAGTPYERPIIGYEDVLNKITRQDIVDYMQRFYQPQSCLLVVCGDFDPAAVKEEIERVFGPLTNNRDVELVKDINLLAQPGQGPLISVEKGPWNKVYLGIAFPSVPLKDARTVHLDVLADLLGGGKTSYLYRKYKYEQQLVDSIYLSNYSFERLGMIYLGVTLDADKLETFWSALTQDLKGINEIAFSEKELERVKLNIEDDFFRARETLSGLTSKIGSNEFMQGGKYGEQSYLYALRNTTLRDVNGQMADLVLPSRISVAVLVPEDAQNVAEAKLKAELSAVWPAAQMDAVAPEAMVQTPSPEIIEIGQGRTLILLPDSTMPYFSANLMFTGGNVLLNEGSQGLGSTVAGLLTKGTAGSGKNAGTTGAAEAGESGGVFNLSTKAYEDYLADRAAALSASSGNQSFGISLTAPERFRADLFSLLAATLESPAFLDDELERVKKNQIAGIIAREDQPLGLAFSRIFPFLFGDHPYGYPALGTPESVEKITPASVASFWQRQKAQPWVLAVCGSFSREEMIEAAKRLPAPQDPAVQVKNPVWSNGTELDLKLPGRNQYHLMLVFPTVGLDHPDYPALNLLQSVLAGQSGLLFTELRDKQSLGYSVTAIPWNTQKAGALIFYIGTDPAKSEQARVGFEQIIGQLRSQALPEAELARGKNAIEGEYYRSHQSLGSRSAEAATMQVLGLPLDTARQQIAKSAAVTPEQLRQIAEKYLNLKNCRQVIVTP